MDGPAFPIELSTRYKDARLLGSGASAHVYHCFDSQRKIEVALKLLRGGIARSENFKRRFNREGRLLASIDHEHIAKCYDFVDGGNHVYLTMEYIKGPTLLHKIREKPLNQEEAVKLLIELSQALSVIHGLSILHRDIKPANIAFADDRAVLMDFGLVKTETTVDKKDLTSSREFVGTPLYLPPEQLFEGVSSEQSDIYQLGLVVFEALVGDLPFKALELEDIINFFRSDESKIRPSDHGIQIDESLDELIARCLQRDPSKRPHSANDVLKQARQLVGWREEQKTKPNHEIVCEPSELKKAVMTSRVIALLLLISMAFCALFFLFRPSSNEKSTLHLEAKSITCLSHPSKLVFSWKERVAVRYRYSLTKGGGKGEDRKLIANGSEERARKEHEITLDGLAPATEYELSLWSGDYSLNKKVTTKNLTLGPLWYVCTLGKNVFCCAPSNSDALRFVVQAGEKIIERHLPPDGRGVLLTMPVPENSISWKFRLGKETVKSGIQRGVLEQDLLQMHTGMMAPSWSGQNLIVHHFDGFSAFRINGQLERYKEFQMPGRFSLQGVKAFCAHALLDKETLLLSSLSANKGILLNTVRLNKDLEVGPQKLLQGLDTLISPCWKGYRHKNKVYFLANYDFSSEISLVVFDSNAEKIVDRIKISTKELLTKSKGSPIADEIGKIVTGTFVKGDYFFVATRSIKRLPDNSMSWQLIGIPMGKKGEAFCYSFKSRSLWLGKVDQNSDSFYVMDFQRLTKIHSGKNSIEIDQRDISTKKGELFSTQVVQAEGSHYFVVYSHSNDKGNWILSGGRQFFDTRLCQYDYAKRRLITFKSTLFSRSEVSSDCGLVHFERKGTYLLGASSRHVFVVKLSTMESGHFMLPTEQGRIVSLSVSRQNLLALMTDENKLLCLQLELVLANESSKLQ